MRLKAIEIIPVQAPILTDTWNLVLNHHAYEADALQITTCSYNSNDALVTSDEKLAQTGRKIGTKTINLPKDELDLKNLMH
jgi:predicted nucleic acid-binding protein